MDSLNYLRNMVRSWWLVLLVTVAGGAGGFMVYAQATAKYSSTVTMIVANKEATVDEATARTLAQLRAQTLAQIAATEPAVTAAVNAAGTGSAGAPSVTATANGAFVSVRVVSTSADVAYRIAAKYPTTLPRSLADLAGNTGTALSLNTVATPVRPTAPFAPSRTRDVLLGLAAGLAIGIALAVLREALNRSIRDSDEANAITRLPVLGVVPRLTPEVPLPALDDSHGARAEAYRQVRTTLLSQSAKRPLVVAVTSATVGEGKTSVATNLAIVLAQGGHTVALVDADMRRPRVAALFGLDADAGLSDVLDGTTDLNHALIDQNVEGLHILPSGATPDNPSELLSTEDLGDLVTKLTQTADFVVIDTPPVLPVTDARELVPAIDGFVFVVEMGGPSRDRVRRAIAALERVNAVLFGLVPNRAGREAARDYRYSY